MIQPSKLKKIEDILSERNEKSPIFIDVRSPSEYLEDHIFGAVNFPVLNDAERAEVGTLYKEDSFAARQLGAKLIGRNLPVNLQKVEDLLLDLNISGNDKKYKPFAVYCWRGGMRSRSLFAVMDMIGYKTFTIDGGYQSYRRYVNSYLNAETFPDTITIYGPSGAGKTELILNLQKNGYPAVHLEKYANHKGSLLGGSPEFQPTQKFFETLLFTDLNKFQSSKIIVEGESKKIGKITLPSRLYSNMMSGLKIWVELPLEVRARRLAEEYNESDEFVYSKLEYLKKFLSKTIHSEIIDSIQKGNRYNASYLFLKYHYDLFYLRGAPEKSKDRQYDAVLKADSFEDLDKQVLEYFKEKFGKDSSI